MTRRAPIIVHSIEIARQVARIHRHGAVSIATHLAQVSGS
jgi:hypothetical protein